MNQGKNHAKKLGGKWVVYEDGKPKNIDEALEALGMSFDICCKVIENSCHSYDIDKETVWNFIEHDYLTINKGRNGDIHYWLLDDDDNVVYNTRTGVILTGEEASQYCEEQFC